MMKCMNYWMIALLTLTLVACGEDEPENAGWTLGDTCTEGQPLELLDAQLCVYDTVRNPIIETGFSCPAELPFQFEFGPDVIVCGRQQTLPAEIDVVVAGLLPEFEIQPPWIVGAEPLQDPRSRVTTPTILLEGRSAGTCQVTTNSQFGIGDYEFDSTGRVIKKGDATYSYDAYGWLSEISRQGATTTFERDESARVTRITSNDGGSQRIIEWTRDDFGRRIGQTITVDGTVEEDLTFTWSQDGLSVDGKYFGLPCDATTTYDQEGRVIQTDQPNCPAFGDPINRILYEGDQYAGVVTVDRVSGNEDVVIDVEFDARGRVTRTQRGIVSIDPDASELIVTYDGDNISQLEVRRISDGSGAVTWQLAGECKLGPKDLIFDFNLTGSLLPD